MIESRKLEIFNAILSLGDNIWGKMDKVDMLNSIWNLHLLNSDDPRYKDAYGDAVQHLRNNTDWDEQYVFLTRFGLLKNDDQVFFKFLEVVVSPEVREDEDEILRYVDKINSLLKKDEKLSLERVATRNGLPVFEISVNQMEARPIDIDKNNILFYVDTAPEKFPAFYLASYTWDDFSRKTKFHLTYCRAKGEFTPVGYVKIMNANVLVTTTVLPTSFYELPNDFCSVGQDLEYYSTIKQCFPDTYRDVLFALKDASYFTKIADKYQYTISFEKSLLRESDALRAFRDARSVLENIDMADRYNFTVNATIPYLKDRVAPVNLRFGNLDDCNNLDRVKALIGENGSGKSSVLFSLAKALNEDKSDMFVDAHKPDFSKVIAISYSIFDNFYKLSKNSSFNFIYCGLRDKDEELISQDDIKKRLELSLGNIKYKGRVKEYIQTLTGVVDKGLLSGFFDEKNGIDFELFWEVRSKMSSGQAMMTSIVTEFFAHIRENSLILFDEPEVHLHSNAITQLLNIVFNICDRFKSACIVATHSSVILQELLARNVTVIERDGETNEPLVRPMNTETLGENLTTITEDVFGRANIAKHYRKMITQLIDEKYSEENICHLLESEGLPMSLNLYMFIRREFEKKLAND